MSGSSEIRTSSVPALRAPVFDRLRRWLDRAPAPSLETLLAALPQIEGAWPDGDSASDPGRPLVFVGCDPTYLREHGPAFARSLDRNSPGCRLHVHLINPDTAAVRELDRIERALAATELTRTSEAVDFAGLSGEFARSYCAGIRFVRLFQLLRSARCGVLLLDIDVLVRGDLGALVRAAEGHDCAIHTRFHKRKKRERLFASVLYMAPTETGLAYLEDVAARIASALVAREARWFVDQCALYAAYRANRASGLRLAHLPRECADWTFGKRSLVWAGKGWRKRSDATYLAARDAFLSKEERLKTASPGVLPARPRIVLVEPRLDLPFHNPGGLRGLPDRLRRRKAQDRVLRAHWSAFAEALAAALRREGCAPERVVRPLWRVSTESVNGLSADVVVIPHRQRFQFGRLDCRTWFYMQTTCPWLFTLDPLGWGPASAGYPCGDLDGAEGDAQVYEGLAERVIGANGSKLAQPVSRSRAELAARGEIPEGPYVFFACQRPNDQAIRFFSPHEPADVVGALARWSDARGLPVVFKAHPSNPKRAAALRAAARGLAVRWSEASVHDLIAHSAAVYVINSGVGFEALLHGKPVVTFGRAEYDAVTLHGDPEDLDAAWRRVEAWDPEARLAAYRRFVAWYCRERCVDLSDPAAAQARLAALARKIVGGRAGEHSARGAIE